MAAAVLLRSLARKMARAPPTRRLHGCARSGPGASSVTQQPTRYDKGGWMWINSGWAMAAAAGLRSLATKLARAPPRPHHRLVHECGLHSLNSPNSGASGSTSTRPTSKIGLATPLAKIRAGVACVLLFGSVVYMYGWLWPQRFEAKLEARTRSILNSAIITEALEILRAEDVPTNGSDVQIKQGSGHQKQPVGETGKGTRVHDLQAELTKV